MKSWRVVTAFSALALPAALVICSCAHVAGRALQGAREGSMALTGQKGEHADVRHKLDSQLFYAVKRARGEEIPEGAEFMGRDVVADARGLTLLDIKADVTDEVLAKIKALGGEIVSSFPNDRSIRAGLPLARLEEFAALTEVQFIRPADQPVLDAKGSQGKPGPADAPAKDGGGADAVVPVKKPTPVPRRKSGRRPARSGQRQKRGNP